jgi:hypothetical protein
MTLLKENAIIYFIQWDVSAILECGMTTGFSIALSGQVEILSRGVHKRGKFNKFI